MTITFDSLTPNLVVANVSRSLHFYRDILGFTVVATVPDAPASGDGPYVFVFLSRGPASMRFTTPSHPVSPSSPPSNASSTA